MKVGDVVVLNVFGTPEIHDGDLPEPGQPITVVECRSGGIVICNWSDGEDVREGGFLEEDLAKPTSVAPWGKL